MVTQSKILHFRLYTSSIKRIKQITIVSKKCLCASFYKAAQNTEREVRQSRKHTLTQDLFLHKPAYCGLQCL